MQIVVSKFPKLALMPISLVFPGFLLSLCVVIHCRVQVGAGCKKAINFVRL